MTKRTAVARMAMSGILVALCLWVTCTTKKLSLDEFKQLVAGKTEQEVEAAVGKPKRIRSRLQAEGKVYWYFVYRTFDPSTGNNIPLTTVVFRDGKVILVSTEQE